MQKIINYLKSYTYYIILLVIYLLIISIFYYFELFNYKTVSIINYTANLVLFFLMGFKISKMEHKRGYLNGFLIAIILIIVFSIISLIYSHFGISNLVYYLSLILSSILGGIFGVTK